MKINLLKRAGVFLLTLCLIVCMVGASTYAYDFDGDGDDDGTAEDYLNDRYDLDGDGYKETYIDSRPFAPVVDPYEIKPSKRETPTTCYIDMLSMLVGGIPYGAKISIDDCGYMGPIYNSSYNLASILLHEGMKICVINPGDGVTTLDSDPQVLFLPAFPTPTPQPTPTAAPTPTPTAAPTPTMPVKVKRPTPAALFAADSFVLASIPDNSRYSLDGGSSWVSCVAGGMVTVPQSSVSVKSDIRVQALARNELEDDSDVQVIDVEQAPKPTGVYTVNAPAGGTGIIGGVNPSEEYRTAGTHTWIPIKDSSITGVYPGFYEVRVAASGNTLASDYITVIVDIIENTKLPTPQAQFIGQNMYLSQLDKDMAISFNNGLSWTIITDVSCFGINISYEQANQAIASGGIRIYRKGNPSEYTSDSDMQVIVITKASTPTGITTVNAVNGANGIIKGVSSDMQYIKEGQTNWIDIGSSEIRGLGHGKYYIRRKGSGTSIPSDFVAVTVKNSQPMNKETVPNAVFNAWNMSLTGIAGCKYSTDGGNNWTKVSANNDVILNESSLSTGHGIKVIKAGNGSTTTDSDIQVIALTKNNPPSGIGAISATGSANGKITGVNSSMQLAAENGKYVDCLNMDVTGLKAGKYYVRVRGAYNALPSDPVVVIIQQSSAAPTVTPISVITPTPQPSKAPTPAPTKAPTPAPAKEPAQSPDVKPTEDMDKESTGDEANNSTDKTKEQESQGEASKTQETKDTSAPVLAEDTSVSGWESIEEHMGPEPVVIEMKSDTVVPASVLALAKSEGTELVLGISPEAVWSIQASAISSNVSDVDLGITDNTSAIPKEALTQIEKKESATVVKQFDIKHNGNFGFDATLTINVGTGYAGKYATLLFYNPDENTMELIGSGIVSETGHAKFHMAHASSYAVVISDKEIETIEAKASNNTAVKSQSIKKNDQTNIWVVVLVAIIIICVISISILSVISHKKKMAYHSQKRNHEPDSRGMVRHTKTTDNSTKGNKGDFR